MEKTLSGHALVTVQKVPVTFTDFTRILQDALAVHHSRTGQHTHSDFCDSYATSRISQHLRISIRP